MDRLIELKNYRMPSGNGGGGLKPFSFEICEGELHSVTADRSDDAHIFFRALATLAKPDEGVFSYRGKALNFSDYTHLLHYKKKVGYICSDSALLGNRTIRENLLYRRYYDEDSFHLKLSDRVLELCCLFRIEDKLDLRPAHVDREVLRVAIIIRELDKNPELVLLERPADYLSKNNLDIFMSLLEKLKNENIPFVFLSNYEVFKKRFTHKEVIIKDGNVEVVG
jgi:ABC-type molybdate transport system ATPase subunit